jgi:hypothetical protein
MADVHSDASQTPAPEAAPETSQAAAPDPTTAATPEPAPAESLKEVAEAAVDATVEAVVEASEAVAETATSTADAVGDAAPDAVVDAVDTVTEAASTIPELDTTTIVPATGGGEGGGEAGTEGGGEWELLLGKVQGWLGQGKLQSLWAQARNPLSLILAAAALLVVLRVYSALLSALDSLPLIPGLLELVGVIWAVRFGVPKLLQRSQRQELISGIQQRWQSFRGRG